MTVSRRHVQRYVTLLLCSALLVSSTLPAASATDLDLAAAANIAHDLITNPSSTTPASANLVGEAAVNAASLNEGTLTGQVVNAAGDSGLAGVLVTATGVLEGGLQGVFLFLPLILRNASSGSAPGAPPASRAASPQGKPVTITTTTTGDGSFVLPLPAGVFTLTFTLNGFGPDRRISPVRANETDRVETVRLHELDTQTTPIGAGGGTASNSLNNTSLVFPAGALVGTEQVRVTYLPNDELPGYFADGSAPVGFANLEPEGLIFPVNKGVLWSVDYTGDLPVGADTLCYWWDGTQNRWRDPVPGKVVDLGGGKKALQATVTHFSAYGHALPAVDELPPGSLMPAGVIANAGHGPAQTICPGCEFNVGTGSVSERYAFPAVASRGFPVTLALRYSTANDTPEVTAAVLFTITSQVPARAEWRIEFQGKTYTGEGYDAQATWDTRNALGYRVAPGIYPFTAVETFYYDSGARPRLAVDGNVVVRRGDLWPFGFNWISSYDTLLVDRSDTVTILQADGQYMVYTRQADGSYTSPAGDTAVLEKRADGTWMRTDKYGGKEMFNALGRLTRMEDRNGNAHTLAYESNGLTLPDGVWGITTRLASITDASGRAWALTYGTDGFVSRVTDPTGRLYQVAHDAAGNLTGVTDPEGRITAYGYDAGHLLTAVTSPRGYKTTIAYDEEGRLATHTDALSGVLSATYGDGSKSFTDPEGNTTSYQTDSSGAVTEATEPGRVSTFTYDQARRLTSSSPPDRRYTYDAKGNLVRISGAFEVNATYEPAFNQPSSVTDSAGNVTTYTYDGHGNLTAVTDALGNASSLAYDTAGQLEEVTDALGHTWQLHRDTHGNITSAIDPLGGQEVMAYDAADRLASFTDAEDATTSYTYDDADRLLSVVDALGRVTSYLPDANSSLKQVTDARGAVTGFTYDALDQLISVTDPLGKQTIFSYDRTGNLDSYTDAEGRQVQYDYDAAGRLTSTQYPGGSTVSFSYDTADRLTGYADANVQTTLTYESELGRPDTVETRITGTGIVSTVSNDYMNTGSASTGAGEALPGEPASETPPNTVRPADDAPPPPLVVDPRDGGELRNPEPAAVPEPERSPSPSFTTDSPVVLAPYTEQVSPNATEVCGTIAENKIWTAAASPYVLTCDVVVAAGWQLTIEPGVVVKPRSYWEALLVNGTLIADGTSSQHIYFTSYKDDTVGGNTDGVVATPAPNDWDSLRLNPGSTGNILDYVEVRYGGGELGVENVYVATTDLTFTNNTVAWSSGNGLRLDNALPAALTGNSFLNNTSGAVYAWLSNNTHSIALSGNTASGNPWGNGFVVEGTIGGNVTWDGDDAFPFVVWNDVTVNAGARLTLTPGTVVKFRDYWDALLVNGTLIADTDAANPIVFTSFKDDTVGGDTDGGATPPLPDDWDSLRFNASSTGSVLDHVVVRYGGGELGAENVYVATTDLTFTNNTVARSAGNGLRLDNALPASLTGNSFLNNASGAVYAWLSNNTHSIALSGNTASGNPSGNGFVVEGTIGGNVTWDGDDAFPFVVWNDVTVNAGARLTLTPGTVVKFRDYWDALLVNGTLIADTDAANPIVFTSFKDDTVGGDTDGGATPPLPDDWDSLRFNASSTGSVLDHVVVRYGGGELGAENVYVATTDLTFTNNTVARSAGDGMKLDNALPAVLTGNSFLDNRLAAIYAPLTNNSQSIALSGNTANGNPNGNAFVVVGTIGGNVIWDGDDLLPFEVWDDLTVNTGARLTLTPGTVVKFRDYWDTLLVNGTLVADGDAGQPITFTSFVDDAVGGDTNSDGSASVPARGNWDSVRFSAASTGSVLDHAVVRYGGGAASESVWTETASLNLTNSKIMYSEDIGLSVRAAAPALTGNEFTSNIRGVYTYEGARPILRSNRITGNRDWGVQNASVGVVVDAERNSWGNATGPYDPSDDRASGGLYNPTSKGDKVSDRVDYDPWQTITGLRYGLTVSTGSSPAQAIRYSYDPLNRLDVLTADGPANFVREYTYDAAGRLTSAGPATGQPGVRADYAYDAASRLTGLTQRNPSGSVTFNDLKYNYDKNGNVLSVSDGSGMTSYTYDALQQLTGVAGPGFNETYTYDATGNRLTKGGVSYSYNAANQLTSASDGTTYAYDKAGNLRTRTKSGQTTFTWDAAGRLIRIDLPDGKYAAYTYDDLSHRISKRDPAGVMTYYVYDGRNLVQELDGSGTVLAAYVHDGLDRPISMTRGGVTYHYLLDRLGNVVGLTDGAGTPVVSYRYDPWGNIIANSNPSFVNPFRFSGREYDDESGFYFFRARYYDPAAGRFISRDPLFGSLLLPRSLNPYVYVSNNPTNLTDRTGKVVVIVFKVLVAVGIVVLLVGGTIYIVPGMHSRASVDVDGQRYMDLRSQQGQEFVKSLEVIGQTADVAQEGIPGGPSSEATSGLAASGPGGEAVERAVMTAEQYAVDEAVSAVESSATTSAAPNPCPNIANPSGEGSFSRFGRWASAVPGQVIRWFSRLLDEGW